MFIYKWLISTFWFPPAIDSGKRLKARANMLAVVSTAQVPKLTVIVGDGFGSSHFLMVSDFCYTVDFRHTSYFFSDPNNVLLLGIFSPTFLFKLHLNYYLIFWIPLFCQERGMSDECFPLCFVKKGWWVLSGFFWQQILVNVGISRVLLSFFWPPSSPVRQKSEFL